MIDNHTGFLRGPRCPMCGDYPSPFNDKYWHCYGCGAGNVRMTFRKNERNDQVKILFSKLLTRLGHKFSTDWTPGYYSSHLEDTQDPELIDCYQLTCTICSMNFDITLVDSVDEKYALWHDHTSFRAIARAFAKYEPIELHINEDHHGRKLHKMHPCICSSLNILL